MLAWLLLLFQEINGERLILVYRSVLWAGQSGQN